MRSIGSFRRLVFHGLVFTDTTEIGTAIRPLRRVTLPAGTDVSPSAQRRPPRFRRLAASLLVAMAPRRVPSAAIPVAFALAVLAVLATTAPEQAAAQTVTTFISNTGQTLASTPISIRATAFTTGTGTYTLSSVAIYLGAQAPSSTPVVQIYTNGTDSLPGTLVANMTNPATVVNSVVNIFTAPANITLSASTTYWVVTSNSAETTGNGFRITTTSSSTLDSGTAAGWSIGGARYKSANADTSWTTSTFRTRFQIRGTEHTPNNNAPTVPNAIPDQTATAETGFSYQFPANTFNDTDTGQTLSYTATKDDGTMLPTWLVFTPGTRTFAGTPAATDVETVSVKVTASDGNGGSVSDEFDITVTAAPPTFISNTGQTLASTPISIRATAFTTGTGTYTLSSVAIYLGAQAPSSTPVVQIYTNGTDSLPGTLVANMTNPATVVNSVVNIFTAPANITLSASTTYWVVTSNSAETTGNGFRITTTSSSTLDSGTAAGWSIGGARYKSANADTSWTTSTFRTRFQIRGTDGTAPTNNAPTVPNAIPDQTATAGTGFSYQFPTNTFNDTDTGQTLSYTATKDDGTMLPTWLVFTASTRTFAGTPATADVGTVAVKVTASDGNGGSVSDTFDFTVAATVPGAPTSLSATASGATTIDLSWTAPADNGGSAVTGYKIEVSPNGTSNWTNLVADTNSTTYAHTGLAAGTTRHYRVSAINSIGTSTPSDVANATTGTATNNAPTVPNAIPDQTATAGTGFSYQFPANSFNDTDTGDTLSYTATKADGMTLPTWLAFTDSTRTFAGTPVVADTGTVSVKVTASDGNGGSVSDTFDITVVNGAGICARTAAVRDALLAKITGVTDCALVTDTHLAAITGALLLNAKSITVLAAGDFDGLTALTGLDLEDNSLTALPAGVFDELTALTRLDLRGNSLTALPARVFDELTALTALNLFGNSLTALPAGVFDGLTALTALSLSANSLTALPAAVFDELTALTELSLSANSLTALPAGVFDELTALTGLHLSRNSLTALPAGVFDGLTALTQLSLSANSLTALPAGVFDGLTALTVLHLEYNSLAELPDDVFEPLTSLTTLDLSGNPGAPFSPTAVALPDDGTVPAAGGTVMLDGSGSGGAWGTNVTYAWALTTPTTGVTVTFDNDSIAKPTVTIPPVTTGTDLVFTLTVTGRPGDSALGISTGTDTAAVTTTTGTTGTTAPGAPTDLTATASGSTTINLTWTAPASNGGSAITGYKIEVSSDGGSSWTDRVANTNSTATTYAHSGLAVGTTRHYRVSAINTNGTGLPSDVDDATTDTVIDTRPPVLTQATVNGGTLVLTYDETLDGASVPAAGAFAVTAAGNAVTVNGVSVGGSAVTLTLANAVQANQTVTLDYTPGASPIQDGAGNDAAALSGQAVTNNTPRVSIGPWLLSVSEGVGDAVLTVSLDRPAASALSVAWHTQDETANAPDDYTASEGPVTFAAGESQKTISVPIVDDAVQEDPVNDVYELFFVMLSPGEGYTLADNPLADSSAAIVEIVDNDGVSSGDAANDALDLVDGVTPEVAAAVLLGEQRLSEAQLAALDRLGNRNGRYDLGDLLSWIARCRRGEARCGSSSTDSGPGSAAMLGAAAAGSRSTPKRPGRRDSGRRGRSSTGGIRHRARVAGYALAILLAATMTWSCTEGLVGPVAAKPDPGFLTVEWSGPATNRDAGVLLEFEGPTIDAVRAPGLELYESSAPGPHRIVVAGVLRPGPLVQFRVPDRNQFALYRVRVLQVTGEDYGLRDVGEYQAVITVHR